MLLVIVSPKFLSLSIFTEEVLYVTLYLTFDLCLLFFVVCCDFWLIVFDYVWLIDFFCILWYWRNSVVIVCIYIYLCYLLSWPLDLFYCIYFLNTVFIVLNVYILLAILPYLWYFPWSLIIINLIIVFYVYFYM